MLNSWLNGQRMDRPPNDGFLDKKPAQAMSLAGLLLFGADGETRTRTAFATTPSR